MSDPVPGIDAGPGIAGMAGARTAPTAPSQPASQAVPPQSGDMGPPPPAGATLPPVTSVTVAESAGAIAAVGARTADLSRGHQPAPKRAPPAGLLQPVVESTPTLSADDDDLEDYVSEMTQPQKREPQEERFTLGDLRAWAKGEDPSDTDEGAMDAATVLRTTPAVKSSYSGRGGASLAAAALKKRG